MLNHAARVYMPVFQDQLRPSVLGRAVGRRVLARRATPLRS
jgi:hypothetical protein